MLMKIGKKFAGDRGGNFSLLGVLAFPVMFSGVALSVDIANNLRARSDLQNANDTAVLFATRFYQEKKAVPSVDTVTKYITANFSGQLQNVKVEFSAIKSEMTVNAESVQKPMMMNYFGNHNSILKAESKATLGVAGILEFALALDTTESMNYENRIGGLKIAARNFVNMLYDVKDRGADVKGAIVPFAR
ncbi:MAG: TadE/TadG family type IV pilus assembly protein, partial [Notoacmeibacter sp.]